MLIAFRRARTEDCGQDIAEYALMLAGALIVIAGLLATAYKILHWLGFY